MSWCLQDLQPQVKLKLLLAFFHISRRNLEAWRPQLDQIIDVSHTFFKILPLPYASLDNVAKKDFPDLMPTALITHK
jgi:hypothetical protein